MEEFKKFEEILQEDYQTEMKDFRFKFREIYNRNDETTKQLKKLIDEEKKQEAIKLIQGDNEEQD